MPHGRQFLPEYSTLGVLTEPYPEVHYRFDALPLEHVGDVLDLGKTARRRPIDYFRELSRIESTAESAGRGGIRPCLDQGDNARHDGRVIVLPSLQCCIDDYGPDVVPATADFGRGVYALWTHYRRRVGIIIIDSHK